MTCRYELTLQPIHEDGSIGFDNQNPVTITADSPAGVADLLTTFVAGHPEHDTWDMTLIIDRTGVTP